jgi:hypothetical protein
MIRGINGLKDVNRFNQVKSVNHVPGLKCK